MASSLSGDRLVVAHCEARQQGLEALLDRPTLLAGVSLQPAPLDLLAAGDDLLNEVGVLVAEEGPDRVQLGVHERLEKGLGAGDVWSGLSHGAHRRAPQTPGPPCGFALFAAKAIDTSVPWDKTHGAQTTRGDNEWPYT